MDSNADNEGNVITEKSSGSKTKKSKKRRNLKQSHSVVLKLRMLQFKRKSLRTIRFRSS